MGSRCASNRRHSKAIATDGQIFLFAQSLRFPHTIGTSFVLPHSALVRAGSFQLSIHNLLAHAFGHLLLRRPALRRGLRLNSCSIRWEDSPLSSRLKYSVLIQMQWSLHRTNELRGLIAPNRVTDAVVLAPRLTLQLSNDIWVCRGVQSGSVVAAPTSVQRVVSGFISIKLSVIDGQGVAFVDVVAHALARKNLPVVETGGTTYNARTHSMG